MTLKEKYYNIIQNCSWYNHLYLAEKYEKIADEFAIEFSRYINNHPKIFNTGNSIEEILKIYKKEKNL